MTTQRFLAGALAALVLVGASFAYFEHREGAWLQEELAAVNRQAEETRMWLAERERRLQAETSRAQAVEGNNATLRTEVEGPQVTSAPARPRPNP